MKTLMRMALAACFFIAWTAVGDHPPAGTAPRYYLAKHGFGGGHAEMVDLSKLPGFENIRKLDEIAAFAAKVKGAVGFTAHPGFEAGERYARAVIWYTALSDANLSWQLHLFDESEAAKPPGSEPRPGALQALDALITSKLEDAQKLIDQGGRKGVRLTGEYAQQKLMAEAVLRLGGHFAHAGTFGEDACLTCRSVVPGGNPAQCGLGVLKVKHWGCCGGAEGETFCHYWEMLKTQEDQVRSKTENAKKPVL